MANLVEIAPVVVERKSFKICKYILAISKVSPLEKGQSPYLNKFESPFPIDALRQGWLKLAQWFLRGRFFIFSSMYFRYFVIISPLGKGRGTSFEQT